jgi:hypothetical protein
MASTPVTASGTACTMRVLRRFLNSGLPFTTVPGGISVVPSEKLLLRSSIARPKLPGACGTFLFNFRPASAGNAGWSDRPPRSKPINLWIRGQRTKHQKNTLFPWLFAVLVPEETGAGLANLTRTNWYAESKRCSALGRA